MLATSEGNSKAIRRGTRMASIIELIKPEIAFDPETIAVPFAALEEAWDRLLQSGRNARGLPMLVPCARSLRGASSI